MRVLVTSWASFLHGEATAGDVLGVRRVREALAAQGIPSDAAWSPGFVPGGLRLEDADPARYTHLVFVCGPAHGWQVRELHERFAACHRIAVGVSVLDPADPAVAGFHRVLPRDDARVARPDLSLGTRTDAVPVVGVVLAPGQGEYGERGRHERVHAAVTRWLATLDCARLPLDTRLDATQWWSCATADQFTSVVSRLDAVVTTRLHGLVLALRAGRPALAVDPIAGGGKVTAQARALGWPALVAADEVERPGQLDRRWRWCLSRHGRAWAERIATRSPSAPAASHTEDERIVAYPDDTLVAELVRDLVAARQPA
ncbi:polysaccharide pyruvyl transferase family protein [Gandjariella thermophila]|uniref:Polysaccharide pyruvyl transferase n=1 Tax=Gandjariella thermophila TaxID=1931992 RepID=A0A4D4JCM8_9PSEU|nr:polysaccharide pyruvyl transferase family protein [Gandjariella thermophila]GDY33374.1 polysaccharide pyruvyl transferase [Gandjariella thermophila]